MESKMDKELIERLKKNTCVFGELPKEERALLLKLNAENIRLLYRGIGNWFLVDGRPLLETTTYRIHPDYTPEPEVIRYEVRNQGGYLEFPNPNHNDFYFALESALYISNFIAYEYASGCTTSQARIENNKHTPAEYPVAVLFAK